MLPAKQQMSINEDNIIEIVKPQILKCRPGDWQHCQRVVYWVKKLAKERKDLFLLIVAAYIHDIGWKNLVSPNIKLTKKKILELQPKASINTKKHASSVLKQLRFSSKDIAKIIRLVKATEDYQSAKSDESILVDSDNLSKTSLSHLKEKYVKSDWMKIYHLFKAVLPKRIRTRQGKKLFPKRLEKLKRKIIEELSKKQ